MAFLKLITPLSRSVGREWGHGKRGGGDERCGSRGFAAEKSDFTKILLLGAGDFKCYLILNYGKHTIYLRIVLNS